MRIRLSRSDPGVSWAPGGVLCLSSTTQGRQSVCWTQSAPHANLLPCTTLCRSTNWQRDFQAQSQMHTHRRGEENREERGKERRGGVVTSPDSRRRWIEEGELPAFVLFVAVARLYKIPPLVVENMSPTH
ncbi:unnamed protein product [Pleuronectes platessa]|uniref:Uncharacterized protein n=1 Tax=Pleuronectes platessa TaxID=8262 RepID=A0A9N7YCE8_PLEPL|nr:unnamed protein product [Pleuronectes platessa]